MLNVLMGNGGVEFVFTKVIFMLDCSLSLENR